MASHSLGFICPGNLLSLAYARHIKSGLKRYWSLRIQRWKSKQPYRDYFKWQIVRRTPSISLNVFNEMLGVLLFWEAWKLPVQNSSVLGPPKAVLSNFSHPSFPPLRTGNDIRRKLKPMSWALSLPRTQLWMTEEQCHWQFHNARASLPALKSDI